MSASIANMKLLRNFRTFISYSALTSIRFQQNRLFQELAATVPPATYETDSEGNIIAPATKQFPTGLDLDPEVRAQFEKDPLRYPKQHPGILTPKKPPELPKRLLKNARQILEEEDLINSSGFEAEVKHLQEVFLKRKPPLDDVLKQQRQQMIAEQLFKDECEKREVEPDSLDEEQLKRLQQKVTDVAKKILHKSTHNYKHIDYRDRAGLVYLAARLTANYTVLHRVFQEIAHFDRSFTPGAVLNVGSGIGSAVWAANAIWKERVYEYYNVDTSNFMNDLARKLLSNDTLDPVNLSIRGVHFRQFIPSPQHNENQFALVVSAYLLMEQPMLEERLHTISLLWELTEQYLVLVEHGTSAGYRLLQEARHLIIQMGKEDPKFNGHVFAPCTHDEICPKLQLQKSPCTFPLQYRKLNIRTEYGQGDTIDTERFSYVVFKKGPRPEGMRYPRITGILHKSSHSHCQMCCSDGSLRHFVITKTKPSLPMFRCTKRCKEGDLLPVQWPKSGVTDDVKVAVEDISITNNNVKTAVDNINDENCQTVECETQTDKNLDDKNVTNKISK